MKKIIVVAATLLSGCASLGESMRPPLPSTDRVTSLSRFVVQLNRSIEDPKVLVWEHTLPTSDVGHREEHDYEVEASGGCSIDTSFQSVDAFDALFDKICRDRGGNFVSPFCRDPSDPYRVLFYSSTSTNSPVPLCANTKGFAYMLKTIEPKSGENESTKYLAELHVNGYRSRAEVAEQEAKARAETERRRENDRIEQTRIVRELPQLRTRGTKICRQESNWLMVAFVESVEAQKIEIRIANIGLPNNPNIHPGGWNGGQIIWDYPEKWRVCD